MHLWKILNPCRRIYAYEYYCRKRLIIFLLESYFGEKEREIFQKVPLDFCCTDSDCDFL